VKTGWECDKFCPAYAPDPSFTEVAKWWKTDTGYIRTKQRHEDHPHLGCPERLAVHITTSLALLLEVFTSSAIYSTHGC
jgi:hypothetical protein